MLHVLPVGDLHEHEESITCSCKPSIITENGTIICVHNAFDNREFIEQLCDEVNNKNNNEGDKFMFPCA